MKVGGIRPFLALALLVSSAAVGLNSEVVNDTIRSSPETEESSDSNIVGLYSDEKWPILRVEMPNKPFPNTLLEDLFTGEFSANEYISQMSGGDSTLNETLIPGVWQSPYPESYWGKDSNSERDVGENGGGAKILAEQTILSLMSDMNLSKWDLDGDYVIDRLLILHSGQPQEIGGPSSSIWSHFSPFDDSIKIGDFTFEHYTMASVHGGVGVLVHEMLHQMGAVDLYDVHSDSPTKSWHGLGDWDIMASGNWLGDGDRPSLPSASTLNIIGASDPEIVHAFQNKSYTLSPAWLGGSAIRIDIAPGEIIWISYRSDYGFDSSLPGHGILVEQQDLFFGDMESNLVNTDPTKPWAKVVEADGNDALLRARDYGDKDDVFTSGDIIGYGGHEIRDNRGRTVPWRITVSSIENESAILNYEYIGDPSITILTPRNPIVLLENESSLASVHSSQDCDLSVQSSLLDEKIVSITEYAEIEIIEAIGIPRQGTLTGSIGCSDGLATDYSLEWFVVNHRLDEQELEETIPWDGPSVVQFYPTSEGEGLRNYRFTLDGPVSRIAEVVTTGNYKPGDPIILDVQPNGLLEPRMIARGELVIIDTDNIEQRIPIVLISEGDLPFGPLNWLAAPSNAIMVVLILLSFSIATGRNERTIS